MLYQFNKRHIYYKKDERFYYIGFSSTNYQQLNNNYIKGDTFMDTLITSAGGEIQYDSTATFKNVKNDFIAYIKTNKTAEKHIANNRLDLAAIDFIQNLGFNVKKYFTKADQKTLDEAGSPQYHDWNFYGGWDYKDERGEIIPYENSEVLDGYLEALADSLLSHLAEINNELNSIIEKKSKFFRFSTYGHADLTPYGKQIVDSLYNFLVSMIKKSDFDDNTGSLMQYLYTYLNPFFEKIENIANMKLTQAEKEVIINYICNKYSNLAAYMKKKLTKKHIDDKINYELLDKLHSYLYAIIRKFLAYSEELYKDDNNIFLFSWLDEAGNRQEHRDLGDIEEDILRSLLKQYKDQIMRDFKLTEEEFNTATRTYMRDYPHTEELLKHIRDLLIAKNQGLKQQRAKDLLTLNDDDKIGVKNSTSIDYDPTNDAVRSKPLIIIKDTTGKDYVFIGPSGASHGYYASNKLQIDIQEKHIEPDPLFMGYGYLLGNNIAFVDEQGDNFQIGYTLADEVNILKNDPRIKKVYTTPGNRGSGGPITRLAKLIYNASVY